MAEVKIYKVTITQGYTIDRSGYSFTLEPFTKTRDELQGYDDGGKIYTLPPGYTLCENNYGTRYIRNAENRYCFLTKRQNNPAIVDGEKVFILPKFEPAEEQCHVIHYSDRQY